MGFLRDPDGGWNGRSKVCLKVYLLFALGILGLGILMPGWGSFWELAALAAASPLPAAVAVLSLAGEDGRGRGS